MPGRDYEWEKIDDNTMKFCVPEEIMSSDSSTLERDLLCQFFKAVQDCGFTTCESLSDNALRVFDSAPGRFIQIGKSENVTVIDEKDGVDSCYYVNSRYCDKVLSEIADFLSMKGVEQTFDFISLPK